MKKGKRERKVMYQCQRPPSPAASVPPPLQTDSGLSQGKRTDRDYANVRTKSPPRGVPARPPASKAMAPGERRRY